LDEDERVLQAILDEEKRTDEKLTGLAKQVVNPDAAAG
jgi:ferritin-like metal-binding protein YciE